MVGGWVAGITEVDGKVHVHVEDCPHYPKHERRQCPRPDSCCVYTDAISIKTGKKVPIRPGDSFWWQSGLCMWTPYPKSEGHKCGVDYDIQLTKLGYSH
jgi:hypothetical protein